MENIVEDIEDKSQTKGSPANSQRYEDMEGGKVVSSSGSVNHSDVLSNWGHRKSRRRQAELEFSELTIDILTNIKHLHLKMN